MSISVISSNEEREAKFNTLRGCLGWLAAGEPGSSAPRVVGGSRGTAAARGPTTSVGFGVGAGVSFPSAHHM